MRDKSSFTPARATVSISRAAGPPKSRTRHARRLDHYPRPFLRSLGRPGIAADHENVACADGRAIASYPSILARNHPDSFGFLDRRHAIMLRWIFLSLVVVALAALATFALQYRSISGNNGLLPVKAKSEGPTPKVELEGNPTHDFGSM